MFEFLIPSIRAIYLYRFGNKLYRKGYCKLARLLDAISLNSTGIDIPSSTNIGNNFKLIHGLGTVIGNGTVIGDDCIVYHHVTLGTARSNSIREKPKYDFPVIGNGVIIYTGAVVLGDIRIGNNVEIGANSVVTHDVVDNAIVAGCPAKILKTKTVVVK